MHVPFSNYLWPKNNSPRQVITTFSLFFDPCTNQHVLVRKWKISTFSKYFSSIILKISKINSPNLILRCHDKHCCSVPMTSSMTVFRCQLCLWDCSQEIPSKLYLIQRVFGLILPLVSTLLIVC